MAVKSKIVKKLHAAIDVCAADATDTQFLAAIAFVESLVTDQDESEEEEEESPAEVKKKGKGKGKKVEKEEEEEEEDSEDEEEEESEDEEEEDEEEEEEESEDEEEEEEEESEEEDEEEEEEEEDESPAPKKSSKKASSKASSDDEEEGRDYKSLNEKKIIAAFKEAGVDSSAYAKIKSDKTKLLKMLKQFDTSVSEFKAKGLAKLTSIAKKQDVEVKFGRGRSPDDKKVRILATALAAASLVK